MFQSLWRDWNECKERLMELQDEVKRTWLKLNPDEINRGGCGWLKEWASLVYQMFESHAGITWPCFLKYIMSGLEKIKNDEKRIDLCVKQVVEIVEFVESDAILKNDLHKELVSLRASTVSRS